MSKIRRYCKSFLFLGALFFLAPSLSYAQERIAQDLGSLQKDPNFGSCCAARYTSGSYAVPDGKTLVIEHVFIELHVPSGVKATGRILVASVTPNSVSNKRYPFLLISQGTDVSGKSIFTASDPVKLYVINRTSDPATISVKLELMPQSSANSSGDNISISGYLEPTAP